MNMMNVNSQLRETFRRVLLKQPFLILLFALAFAVPFNSSTATDLYICNKTNLNIYSSIVYYDKRDKDWWKAGWYLAPPGDCTFPDAPSDARASGAFYYYVHSEAYQGSNVMTWKPDTSDESVNLCVPGTAFKSRDSEDAPKCEVYKFIKRDLSGRSPYKMWFGLTQSAQRLACKTKPNVEKYHPVEGPLSPIKRTILGYNLEIPASARHEFTSQNEEAHLSSTITLDLGALQSKFPSVINSYANLPGDSCNDRYSIGNQRLAASGGGSAVGSASITYSNWSCCKKCVPCGTWKKPFRMCDATNKNFQKTIGVIIKLRPRVVGNQVDIGLTGDIDDRGGIPQILADIVRIFRGTDPNRRLAQMKRELSESVNGILFSEAIPSTLKQYEIKIRDARFVTSNGRLALSVGLTASLDPEEACDLFTFLVRDK